MFPNDQVLPDTLGLGPSIANHNGICGRYFYRSATGHFRLN